MTPENTGQLMDNTKNDKVSTEISSLQTNPAKRIKDSFNEEIETKKKDMTVLSTESKEEFTSIETLIQKDKPLVAFTEKAVNVPDIGSDEVEVTEILVQVGDKVEAEQSLITVEGDKASIEVPAPFSGTVKEIRINIKDKVSTGSLIMIFEVEDVSSIIPPTTVDTFSCHHATKSESIQSTESILTPVVQVEQFEEYIKNNAYIYATPLIRRLARKLKIDLRKVQGSGRKGRILREDIYSYLRCDEKHDPKTLSEKEKMIIDTKKILSVSPLSEVDFSQFGEIEIIPLSRIQKISGKNLSRNWITIPHVTHFDKSDITDLENFRKQQNNEEENLKLNIKFTLMPFIMKAVAVALKKMPRFSSSLSEDGQRLILKKYINIGIAVDTVNGLVVPVVKDVNKKNITELSHELTFISQKARTGKLTTKEMQGGCFTISNIGSLGTTYFSPIVNAPEVAILGVSQSKIESIWNGKEFIPRLMMPISLSFDHRVIDGADGARFVSVISKILGDIRQLLI